jgi:catechol 2,3-dioxygenase-like lactoylglutathione lyase family enzyme
VARLRNPDHMTIAVGDGEAAIEFFEMLGFRYSHETTIDGGEAAGYMGMADMKARHMTLEMVGSDPHFEIQLLEFDPTRNQIRESTPRTTDDADTTTSPSGSTTSRARPRISSRTA